MAKDAPSSQECPVGAGHGGYIVDVGKAAVTVSQRGHRQGFGWASFFGRPTDCVFHLSPPLPVAHNTRSILFIATMASTQCTHTFENIRRQRCALTGVESSAEILNEQQFHQEIRSWKSKHTINQTSSSQQTFYSHGVNMQTLTLVERKCILCGFQMDVNGLPQEMLASFLEDASCWLNDHEIAGLSRLSFDLLTKNVETSPMFAIRYTTHPDTCRHDDLGAHPVCKFRLAVVARDHETQRRQQLHGMTTPTTTSTTSFTPLTTLEMPMLYCRHCGAFAIPRVRIQTLRRLFPDHTQRISALSRASRILGQFLPQGTDATVVS